jgi:alpha-tubulin suppressor-like RCC1 family protein
MSLFFSERILMNKFKKSVAVLVATAVAVVAPLGATAAYAEETIDRTGIYVWGSNISGSLGTGDDLVVNSPKLINSLSDFPIVALSTSATHTLFTDDKGNVYAVGDNSHGQLGDGTTTSSKKYVTVTLPLRNGVPDYATQVWAENGVSYMVGGFGNLYSWGSNANGLTAQRTVEGNTLTPKLVQGLPSVYSDSTKFSVSEDHASIVGVNADGYDQLYSWGANNKGQLGNATLGASVISSPSRILIPNPEEETTKTIELCGIDAETQEEVCESIEKPKVYEDYVGFAPSLIANGNNFSTVVTSEGVIYTWGGNNLGQLGINSDTASIANPQTTSALNIENGASVLSISAGDDHVILYADNGLLYGWGSNSHSQTAPYYNNSTTKPFLKVLQRLTILKENNDLAGWEYVIASGNSSYAATNDGNLYAWGDNSGNQLANLKTTVTTPTRIAFPYETQITRFVAGGANVLVNTNYIETYPSLEFKNDATEMTTGAYNKSYTFNNEVLGGYPGNKMKWTISGLPAGMNYDSATGNITGAPTTIGEFEVEVAVTDNVNTITKSLTLVVTKSTPTITPTYATTLPGKILATVTVKQGNVNATGTVTFYNGTATTTSTLVNGVATATLSNTPGVAAAVKAVYNGSTVLNSITSATQQFASLNKYSVVPKPIHKLSGNTLTTEIPVLKNGTTFATGTVTLYNGTTKIGSGTLVNGTVKISSDLSVGTYKLTAKYSGDSLFKATDSTVSPVTVAAKYATAVKGTFSVSGDKVTVVVDKLSKNSLYATGTVALYNGSTKLATGTLVNGTVKITTPLNVGKYNLTLKYSGDTKFAASNSAAKAVSVTVKHAPTLKAVSTVNNNTVTTKVTTTAFGTTYATGTVKLYEGNTVVATGTLKNGVVTFTTSMKTGSHTLVAKYAGDSKYNSGNSAQVTVKVTTKYSVTPVATATISGKIATVSVAAIKSGSLYATGTVVLYEGNTKLATATLTNGTAKLPKTLTKGTHTLTVKYLGNSYFNTKNAAPIKVTIK